MKTISEHDNRSSTVLVIAGDPAGPDANVGCLKDSGFQIVIYHDGERGLKGPDNHHFEHLKCL